MNKTELDFEIQDTKRAIVELKSSKDSGAVMLAQADLDYLLTL